MKCFENGKVNIIVESHPARGAWIEMSKSLRVTYSTVVAPRKGCVD